MKSFKFALALTTLFTGYTIESRNIVTIETAKIMQDSQAGNKIKKRLEKKQMELTKPFAKLEEEMKIKEAELMEKQKNLAKKGADLEKKRAVISQESYLDQYDELQKEHRDIEAEIANFRRSMMQAQEDAKKIDQKLEIFYRKEMMAFEQKIKSLIEQVAKAEGWDIVLAKEACIYTSESTDKTEKVIKELDKQEEKEEEKSSKPATPKKTTPAAGA